MLKKGKHHDAMYWMNATIFFVFLRNNFPFLQRFSVPVGERMRKLINESLGTQPTSQVFKDSALSREEMVAESFIQLFAGTDTTSNTMTWFFYLIAKHPQVEAKLMEELRATGILEKEGLVSSSDFF
ncbi:Cytochrome P450 3A4 [Entomophthora muscae]|uniref:Cytochrome P450 3A4 n=1 Tax=Entomophthora muscae TaxID=34485 RepID=A0ACC2RXQ4_9FUNG|nr:Cytochrome P450 3A4 [Entomophthora muscae]